MEIFLNLVWAALALVSIGLWARYERRTGSERYLPVIALVLLLIVLFPVISVSDDLWAMQNPAEADTCLRRSDTVACPHSIFPRPIAQPVEFFSPNHSAQSLFCAQVKMRVPNYAAPALNPIESRPPPVA